MSAGSCAALPHLCLGPVHCVAGGQALRCMGCLRGRSLGAAGCCLLHRTRIHLCLRVLRIDAGMLARFVSDLLSLPHGCRHVGTLLKTACLRVLRTRQACWCTSLAPLLRTRQVHLLRTRHVPLLRTRQACWCTSLAPLLRTRQVPLLRTRQVPLLRTRQVHLSCVQDRHAGAPLSKVWLDHCRLCHCRGALSL